MSSVRRVLPALICALSALTAPVLGQAAGEDALARIQARQAAGDLAGAHAELEALASTGDGAALAALARNYEIGLGVPQDFARAAVLYGRAVDEGNADAANALARAHADGRGVPQDPVRALGFFERAAEAGAAEHILDFAVALETGVGTEPDPAAAAVWYQRAVDEGSAAAMTSLGLLYLEGRGVEEDGERAYQFFSDAVSMGDARAMNNLGLMFVRGEHVERDYTIAFGLFDRAAELGLNAALSNLSVMYANGYGVEVDEAESERLLLEARRSGAMSLNTLLEAIGMPFDGRIVGGGLNAPPSELEEAAAQGGDPVALYLTGWRYLHGLGVHQDFAEATRRLEAASATGMGSAQLTLGLMYAHGFGVPQDYVEAYVWASLSSLAHTPGAAELRDALLQELPAGLVVAAQARVSAYHDEI
jgi:TPR repeat protein